MTARRCPVKGCDRALGTSKQGDPLILCAPCYRSLSRTQQQKLWQAFKAWQRLEKKYLALPVAERPPALLNARAEAVKAYLEIRGDCIRAVTPRDHQQLEMA